MTDPNPNLLGLGRLPVKGLPLFFEFPASMNPEAYPYLVTSTKSLFWIWRPFKTGMVRSAVRSGLTLDSLYQEILQAVVKESLECKWGSIHPFTPQGIQAAKDHVNFYEFGELEVLSSDPLEGSIQATWVPPKCAVILPKERSFVGTLNIVGSGFSVVVHNPSRGIGVAVDTL